MRIVLQRVRHASVKVDGAVVGLIKRGFLVLLGVHRNDTVESARFLARKCAELRVFEDAEGKMNLSVREIEGEVLVISQFTLYGDCRKGKRPSFSDAAPPPRAIELYEEFIKSLREHLSIVQTGIFGATMEVELLNDGPITLILEK
ncbi:MAG: D-tyrosyl-tRNA(Tyr) deacylase [Pedosphaera sp.]|nr:D-tyrosyl-tRNA(Tyr) deacylase [Pedosphaera sp.]